MAVFIDSNLDWNLRGKPSWFDSANGALGQSEVVFEASEYILPSNERKKVLAVNSDAHFQHDDVF